MTQYELLFELDCSAEDVGAFLYADAIGSSRRLALGSLIDLVASAFDVSGLREPIALELALDELPDESTLTSLRLQLNPPDGLFVVEFATRDVPNSYKRILSGQRTLAFDWPSWTSPASDSYAGELDVASFAWPPSFAVVERGRALGRNVELQFALSDAARDECQRFSMHPLALTLALKIAADCLAEARRDLRLQRIARVAIAAPGAIPARMIVEVDEAATTRSARATLLDVDDRPIAWLDGIEFGPAREPLSFARLEQIAFESLGRRVAADEHLLRSGLSSLDIVRLVSAVYAESRVDVSLEALLERPSLERLHELLGRGSDSEGLDSGDRLERIVFGAPNPPDRSPLASMQRAFWLASLKRNAGPAYIESALFRLRGKLDLAALEFAWTELSRRYESLRSAITEEDGQLWQRVLPSSATIETLQATGPEALERFVTEPLQRPFTSGERLALLQILRLAADDHVLLLAAHHAVCDGGSFAERVIPELADLYACARAGRLPAAASASAQPRHLAAWETDAPTAARLSRESAVWAEELSNLEAMPTLPNEREPPLATVSARGARHTFELPSDLAAKLAAFARSEGQSQFVVALSAFALLLYRFVAQRDLMIGVPVAQRFAPLLTRATGCLINFAPLGLRVDGERDLRELLRQVGERVARLVDRQRVPFQLVAAQLPESHANPNVGFSFESSWPTLQLAGLESERLEPELTHSKLELFLRLESSGDRVRALFEYSTDRFQTDAITALAARYQRLLECAIDAPETRLRAFPYFQPDEQTAWLAATRGESLTTAIALPTLLASRARARPTSVAVSDGTRTIDYAELIARAAALGRALRAAGVERGDAVAIYLERSIEWPIAVLGLWNVGAVLIPIDADQPAQRRAYMLDVAAARAAVTQHSRRYELQAFGIPLLCIEDVVDDGGPADAFAPAPSDIAYGIFTSGSTGSPKLALASHGGLANKALAQLHTFGLREGARVMQFASLAFDAALSELMLGLCAGGTLVLPANTERYSGAALCEFMQRERIEAAMLTPSVVTSLPIVELPQLRLLLVVGERCSAELVEAWAVGRELYNLYGPTEATIWSSFERCQIGRGEPSLGRPIANSWIYVLDEDANLLGPAQVGEICIGGATVGPGYKHASAADHRRFVPDPYCEDRTARMYRTGDRGRWLSDGRLRFVGRNDDQVKVFGRRIELGEIENALRRLPEVAEAAVVIHQPGTASARIAAFVQTRCPAVGAELREALRDWLPNHMLPSSIVVLDAWPRLVSGKIDRAALSARSIQHVGSRRSSEAERVIAGAFARVLRIDPSEIGPDDEFSALGGRSLDVVRLAEELARVGVIVAVAELLQSARVSDLARLSSDESQRR